MPAFVVDARDACFFVGLDLDQHVTREELALGTALLAGAHFDHFFGRDEHVAEAVLHLVAHNAIAQCLRHRLLKT
jgi:hypothetical protein